MPKYILFIFACLWANLSYAGGFIIVSPETHQNPTQGRSATFFPLETRFTKIDVALNSVAATTTLQQVFYNPTNRRLEGYFLFPVPKEVVIDNFTMEINGKATKAELLDAKKARKIYEDIVRRAKDPALLEFYSMHLFRVRIFPIEPRSEQRISLTYTEQLQTHQGQSQYTFPLNTEKYSAKPIENLSIRLKLHTEQALKNVYCPSHTVDIRRKGAHDATIGYEAETLNASRDFEVFFNTNTQAIGLQALMHRTSTKKGYFTLNISPGEIQAQQVIAKDIVFVLDHSGSMSGEKMQQARKALEFCLQALNTKDQFEIIAFSTEATSLFGKVRRNNAAHRKEAKDFLETIEPIGGTNIEEALTLALQARAQPTRPFFVVFITDGKPTIGEIREEKLLALLDKQNTAATRIFTFGIGNNLNTHLLDKLTQRTNAYRSYVHEDEDIADKVASFYEKIASPVLTDVELVFDRKLHVSDVYPKKCADLFKGQSLSIMGRYSGTGEAKIKLKGNIQGKRVTFEYPLTFAKVEKKHAFVADLWATRAVAYLLDQIRLQGPQEELITEVTRLAKKHGIITPYTSFLIIEDEAQLPPPDIVPFSEGTPPPPPPLLRTRLEEATAAPKDLEESDRVIRTQEKSGQGSVAASQRNQKLQQSLSKKSMRTEAQSLNYVHAKSGKTQNLADQIENHQGRAFYQNNTVWIDANLAVEAPQNNTQRIAFGSAQYFKLLNEHPEVAELLALGRQVHFVHNNTRYEIHE